MKHIIFFLTQTLFVMFYFTPIVIGRFIWTFRWNDKFEGIKGGIYSRYKRCYFDMVKKIKGYGVPSTY